MAQGGEGSVSQSDLAAQVAIMEYMSRVKYVREKAVIQNLLPKFKKKQIADALSALAEQSKVVRTRGLCCLPDHEAEAAAHAKGAQHSAPEPKTARRSPLRRTERSSPPTAGGAGECDKCGGHASDRNHITHTTWGDVNLCHRCCVEVESRNRIEPVTPFIRTVSAPIGSGRHQ